MAMHSESRNGAKVIWLGVHTTEGMMRATALRDWTGWPGSSHASSDETGALLGPNDGFVPYNLAAWTLRAANAYSENIEQCGWTHWSRAEWLSRPKLLDATARWLAERSIARGIPLRRLSDAEIRNRVPGVVGHGDYTRATGDGSHTDPGPGYPWDVVLDKANQYAAGKAVPSETGDLFMALTDAQQLRLLEWADKGLYTLGSLKENTDRLPAIQAGVDNLTWGVLDESQGLRVAVAGLYAKLAEGNDITAEEIAALIPEGLANAVAEALQNRQVT